MNHVVYTLYNEAGEAIYVGVTSRWPHRLSAHRREKAWFGEVARHEVERFATGNEARDREHAIITSQKPKYNRKMYHQGKTGPLSVDLVPVSFTVGAEGRQILNQLSQHITAKTGRGGHRTVIELAIRHLAKQSDIL